MSHLFGVAIESLVAILLLMTIGYCMLLNSRLKRLKADEHSLKATIGELITATEIVAWAISVARWPSQIGSRPNFSPMNICISTPRIGSMVA